MITDTIELRQRAQVLLNGINRLEIQQAGVKQTQLRLEQQIEELKQKVVDDKEALDIATHAIEILRQVSDEAVSKAYGFLEKSLNSALERMFTNTTRKIRIHEYIRNNQYPQLELELDVGNGIKRSLRTDSGHGLAQIVSLLSILSLIVITGSRRILVMDEVLSGVSVHNRKIVEDILWSFTEIGFQFIINEHGFIPKGSNVFHLEMVGDVSHIKQNYIATQGVYLQGGDTKNYDYSNNANSRVYINSSKQTDDSLLDYDETTEVSEEFEDDIVKSTMDLGSAPTNLNENLSGDIISI